jgi:hypothetical protein
MEYHRDRSQSDQCLQWNSGPEHQRLAGQARARQFTREHQAQAGQSSYVAVSARWRAGQGLAPLSLDAALRQKPFRSGLAYFGCHVLGALAPTRTDPGWMCG